MTPSFRSGVRSSLDIRSSLAETLRSLARKLSPSPPPSTSPPPLSLSPPPSLLPSPPPSHCRGCTCDPEIDEHLADLSQDITGEPWGEKNLSQTLLRLARETELAKGPYSVWPSRRFAYLASLAPRHGDFNFGIRYDHTDPLSGDMRQKVSTLAHVMTGISRDMCPSRLDVLREIERSEGEVYKDLRDNLKEVEASCVQARKPGSHRFAEYGRDWGKNH